MAPTSKKAKRPSDASDCVPPLTPVTSFSSTRTSQSSRRPSLGPPGPFQSPPPTPQSNGSRGGQTSAPISRVASKTSLSFAYPTADPEIAFNLIDQGYFQLKKYPLQSPPETRQNSRNSSFSSSNVQSRALPEPSRQPPSPPLVQAAPTHHSSHRRRRGPLGSSDSALLLAHESPLTRCQTHIASYAVEPARELGNMDGKFLAPAAADSAVVTKQKEKTRQTARDQQQALAARLENKNLEMPPFEFLELIGKGAFGRVFKAKDLKRNKVVALKVVDVDPHDYKVHVLEKDESIQTVLHEIKILTQLRDSNVKNINLIIDAFPVHSQLWIVTEYCPGGSLHTLLQGVGSKLEEKYIIPVARELAIALKAIHAANIIHRDVKAANVMIHENGSLQLIDFGVSGLLQTSNDKRSTIIGTPHWMPPEMSSQLANAGSPSGGYATEIDVWAYGCTLFEIATGNPPYHKAEPGRKLTMMLKRSAPTLKEEDFSDGLVDLVKYIMKTSPQDRPSMDAILQHPYLLGTEVDYPTKSLADLVKIYYRWEYSGGQRLSLFMPGGAAAAPYPTIGDDDGEWNFSTTMNFDAQHMNDAVNVDTSQPGAAKRYASHKPSSSLNFAFSMSDPPEQDDYGYEVTVTAAHDKPASTAVPAGNIERAEKSLLAIFNPSTPEVTKPPLDRSFSDLPLRNASSGYAVHKEVDKSTTVKTPSIDLSSVNTIKANRRNRSGLSLDKLGAADREDAPRLPESTKRATMEWSFATAQEAPAHEVPVSVPVSSRQAQRDTLAWSFATAGTVREEDVEEDSLRVRPPLRHMATQPIGKLDPRPHSVLDLDELWESDLSSAINTAPASDDEGFAAYDLSDAHQPLAPPLPPDLPAISLADNERADDEEEEDPSAPHPLSALRAPAKLKIKMIKALVRQHDLDPALAEQLVIGDPAPPDNLVDNGHEDHALACAEAHIAAAAHRHGGASAVLPLHVQHARRTTIMNARLAVFGKYLASGAYPFAKYYSAWDHPDGMMGREYDTDGEEGMRDSSEDEADFNDDEDNNSSDDHSDEDNDRIIVEADEDDDDDNDNDYDASPPPRLRGVDPAALVPGAGKQALGHEFRAQLDQFANHVLPWASRKLKALARREEERGRAEEGGVDEGAEGGDEA